MNIDELEKRIKALELDERVAWMEYQEKQAAVNVLQRRWSGIYDELTVLKLKKECMVSAALVQEERGAKQ